MEKAESMALIEIDTLKNLIYSGAIYTPRDLKKLKTLVQSLQNFNLSILKNLDK
jgi:hypothetical protein